MNMLSIASIEITRRCNNKCPYCQHKSENVDFQMDKFIAILDELLKDGCKAVALGGGEPTLHPGLPFFLNAAKKRGLKTGLTTNSQDPKQIIKIADDGLLYQFGVSAGKGAWKDLASHPLAVVNLLMLKNGLDQVMKWTMESFKIGTKHFLLMGYKGTNTDFIPSKSELSNAFAFLTGIRRKFGIEVAADDYIRRKIGLAKTCGTGFVRIDIAGNRDICCFPECEFRQPLSMLYGAFKY